VGTAEEYALETPVKQHEMMLLIDADHKRIRDQNLNKKGILSPAQTDHSQTQKRKGDFTGIGEAKQGEVE